MSVFKKDKGLVGVLGVWQDGANVVVEDPIAFVVTCGLCGEGVEVLARVDWDRRLLVRTGLMSHRNAPAVIGGPTFKTGCFNHIERSLFDVENLMGFVDDGVLVNVFGGDESHGLFVDVISFVNGFNHHWIDSFLSEGGWNGLIKA